MLRAATGEDLGFLREVLHLAAFPPGTPVPPAGIDDDHVARYLEAWGRPGDLGLVAWIDGAPVGAGWVRLMDPGRPGYGFVDDRTPELTVAVIDAQQGRGLGRALVAGILDLAAVHGHDRVSLSVADAVNPVATGLYRSLGFTEVGRDGGGSLTMVAATAPPPPA
ncbi:MAG: GNAT family N-acetyltransferase [Iamia sp.]